MTSFDAGRGCPFQCSFCTIINVQWPQVAQAHARRRRAAHPHEHRPGRELVLHHRRQLRPQPRMGADLRPHHRGAQGGKGHRARSQDHHPGRYALPQEPEFHREGAARRRAARLHRAGEHQPQQSRGGQEAAEQDHRISPDAARLEACRHHQLCGLHPRLPERHAGKHRRGHRDHPARAAARYPGVLLPHALARLGGPQEAVAAGRRDGHRHEPLRRGACRHRAPQDDARAVGGGLSAGVEALLLARAHRAAAAACRRDRDERVAARHDDFRLLVLGRDRGHAPAAMRDVPPQASHRPASGHADRAGLALLSRVSSPRPSESSSNTTRSGG